MAFNDSELRLKNTVLLVKDVGISKKFYTEIMNQEIAMDIGINVGFKSGLALWKREFGEYTINNCVKEKEHKFTPKDARQHSSIELYFEIVNFFPML